MRQCQINKITLETAPERKKKRRCHLRTRRWLLPVLGEAAEMGARDGGKQRPHRRMGSLVEERDGGGFGLRLIGVMGFISIERLVLGWALLLERAWNRRKTSVLFFHGRSPIFDII